MTCSTSRRLFTVNVKMSGEFPNRVTYRKNETEFELFTMLLKIDWGIPNLGFTVYASCSQWLTASVLETRFGVFPNDLKEFYIMVFRRLILSAYTCWSMPDKRKSEMWSRTMFCLILQMLWKPLARYI